MHIIFRAVELCFHTVVHNSNIINPQIKSLNTLTTIKTSFCSFVSPKIYTKNTITYYCAISCIWNLTSLFMDPFAVEQNITEPGFGFSEFPCCVFVSLVRHLFFTSIQAKSSIIVMLKSDTIKTSNHLLAALETTQLTKQRGNRGGELTVCYGRVFRPSSAPEQTKEAANCYDQQSLNIWLKSFKESEFLQSASECWTPGQCLR